MYWYFHFRIGKGLAGDHFRENFQMDVQWRRCRVIEYAISWLCCSDCCVFGFSSRFQLYFSFFRLSWKWWVSNGNMMIKRVMMNANIKARHSRDVSWCFYLRIRLGPLDYIEAIMQVICKGPLRACKGIMYDFYSGAPLVNALPPYTNVKNVRYSSRV